MELGVYIAAGTFALSIIVYAIKLTWKLREVEREIREEFDAEIENLQRDVSKLERECVSRADSVRLEAGEMGSAIRQKIHELEVFSRDTFAKQIDLDHAINRMEASIDKRIDKLEENIDKAIDRLRASK